MTEPILFIILLVSITLLLLALVKISHLKQHGLISRKGVFKIIDRVIIIFSTIGILITILWDFNYVKYKPPIQHKDWERIALNDFRGLNRPHITLYGESKFAFVSTSIRARKSKDKIIIESLFHPCRSYVYNRRLFSKGLLTHEMYHFHITEYCARLFRKDVLEFDEFGIDYNLSKLKRQVLVYERSLQEQYDDETYHSYVHGKQLEWQEKVDSLLKSLDEYSNTIISLKN